MTIKAKATRGFLGDEGRVRRNAPIDLEQGEFDRLKALGLVEKAGESGGPVPKGEDDLDTRTVEDLTELAQASDIDIGGAKKKADIVAAIRAHRAKG